MNLISLCYSVMLSLSAANLTCTFHSPHHPLLFLPVFIHALYADNAMHLVCKLIRAINVHSLLNWKLNMSHSLSQFATSVINHCSFVKFSSVSACALVHTHAERHQFWCEKCMWWILVGCDQYFLSSCHAFPVANVFLNE